MLKAKEKIMARWMIMALLGLAAFVGVVGCEADVDDDGAKIKVDADD